MDPLYPIIALVAFLAPRAFAFAKELYYKPLPAISTEVSHLRVEKDIALFKVRFLEDEIIKVRNEKNNVEQQLSKILISSLENK